MAIIKPEQISKGFYNITGSLFGTASYATTASYALNNPTTDIFRITTGSVTASVNVKNNIFLITSASANMLSIDNTGILTLATQSNILTTPAPLGGIYFTSSSMYIGLE